jgi:polyisoprenoid-binding protein YceI
VTVALLHAAAALYHHFGRKDEVLRRMLPFVGVLVLLLSPGNLPAATAWQADPAASRLLFTATQAGADFEGRFARFAPKIQFDPADLAGSRFDVEIDTRSADTQDQDRDTALASDDFFATGRWPSAHFVATSFAARGAGKYEARGQLTIRDVTREVLLPFSFSPAADGHHARLTGGTTIHRLDFGVGQGEWTDTKWVGNDVRIRFELELAAATGGH